MEQVKNRERYNFGVSIRTRKEDRLKWTGTFWKVMLLLLGCFIGDVYSCGGGPKIMYI
jgi:hypothetical protein